MKRKCKNVDITNLDFLKSCVAECFVHKSNKQMRRKDIRELFDTYQDIDGMATNMQHELLTRKIALGDILYKDIIDPSNGKIRHLAVEDIRRQLYGYVAAVALEQGLGSYIGHYQIANRKGCGSVMASHLVQNWLKDKQVQYMIKMDIRHCYESITHQDMMAWLRKHTKNDLLVWLVGQLLGSTEEGLIIGSRLSVTLCALYLADLYHRLEDHYFYWRRDKRHNTVLHQLFNVDDIFIFGANAKELNRLTKDFILFAKSKGLTVKPDWQLISFRGDDACVDVLGYKVYRDRITLRRRNYIKLKRTIRCFKRAPTLKNARSLCSRYGQIKHSNSRRFCQKYNAYAAVRSARKVVSNHDKSKICRQAGYRAGQDTRRRELLCDRTQ